jgi:hypothetical protein
MAAIAKLSPIAQMAVVSGRLLAGSAPLRPNAARVAKKITKDSKLSTIEARARLELLVFFIKLLLQHL